MAVKSIDELKPVYLIHGDQELLLERALHRLRERVAAVADLDFNFETFAGESSSADAVVAAANTLPFASERRLVVVRDVDRMSAADQSVLAEYARDPSPTSCLVLVATKVNRGSRLYKAVEALGGVARYDAPTRNEYPGWVVELFASKGRRIGLDAASLLVRSAGRDLRRLEIEADKVIAFAGDRETIERTDVEQLVARTAPTSVFDMLNAIGARECATALGHLDHLLAGGEHIVGIHAMVVRHLRTLTSARALLDRGASGAAAEHELGMKQWQVRSAFEQAKRFTAPELSGALRQAAEVERALKTGKGDPRVVLEVWIVDMCAPRP